jgi:hypothetical protein
MRRTQREMLEINHVDVGLFANRECAAIGQANDLSRKCSLLPDN